MVSCRQWGFPWAQREGTNRRNIGDPLIPFVHAPRAPRASLLDDSGRGLLDEQMDVSENGAVPGHGIGAYLLSLTFPGNAAAGQKLDWAKAG